MPCKCEWKTLKPHLNDPEISYDMEKELLIVKVELAGRIFITQKGSSTILNCGMQVDIHKPDESGKWEEVLDGKTSNKRKTISCTGADYKDFTVAHKSELKIDAQKITGTETPLLLEVYWKVDGCGRTFGGYRLFKRISVSINPYTPSDLPSAFESHIKDGEWRKDSPLPGDG